MTPAFPPEPSPDRTKVAGRGPVGGPLMIRVAGEIRERPGHWWCDQLRNHDAVRGYLPLGDEIWEQVDAKFRHKPLRIRHDPRR